MYFDTEGVVASVAEPQRCIVNPSKDELLTGYVISDYQNIVDRKRLELEVAKNTHDPATIAAALTAWNTAYNALVAKLLSPTQITN